jgi:ParB family transcriptional regulator, chromosome partitioning protein
LRKLRVILRDPVAKEHFLSADGDLESALTRVAAPERRRAPSLSDDLDAALQSMKRVPWTQLEQLRGDRQLLGKIEEAETLLRSLRNAIRGQ